MRRPPAGSRRKRPAGRARSARCHRCEQRPCGAGRGGRSPRRARQQRRRRQGRRRRRRGGDGRTPADALRRRRRRARADASQGRAAGPRARRAGGTGEGRVATVAVGANRTRGCGAASAVTPAPIRRAAADARDRPAMTPYPAGRSVEPAVAAGPEILDGATAHWAPAIPVAGARRDGLGLSARVVGTEAVFAGASAVAALHWLDASFVTGWRGQGVARGIPAVLVATAFAAFAVVLWPRLPRGLRALVAL